MRQPAKPLPRVPERTDAISVQERAVAEKVRVLGRAHPDTLTARANLAALYSSAGRAGQAIGEQEHLVIDCERVLGSDHPDTVTARANLGAFRRLAPPPDPPLSYWDPSWQ